MKNPLIASEEVGEGRIEITDWLKLISGAETLELDETDGKETIAKAKADFTAGIDSDFKSYGCDVKSEPTKKTRVTVHEMIKDGTFAEIFGSMSSNLNSLYLTQPQILQFVRNHRKWLRTDGYATLFLFKVGDELFVARVHLNPDESLGVRVYRFFCFDSVWGAKDRHRVVRPQLPLENQP